MCSKIITVFTPTYNRAYILHRLYQSLKRQTCSDFEWLIVDDGSTDNTAELAGEWIKENIIKIRYFKQANGGKQRAHNYGIELCGTELFINVDSDDYLTDNAIEEHLLLWDSIEDKESVSGILSMRGKDADTPIAGRWFPENVRYSTSADIYRKHKYKGDSVLLHRTDILRRFPFYVADGEKFMGESYVWQQIDQEYVMAVLPKITYICEYLPDGYSANVRKLLKNNPIGYRILNRQMVVYSVTFTERYVNMMRYIIACKLSKVGCMEDSPSKFLTVLAYIPAMFFYWKLYGNL